MTARSRVSQYIKMVIAMPINNYEFVNPVDTYVTIEDTSRRIANSPRFEAKLRRYYKGCKNPINVWIVNKHTAQKAIGRGVESINDFLEEDADFLSPDTEQEFNKVRANKSINFIIAGDVLKADSNSHPITPWMVGHRLGHGVLESHQFSKEVFKDMSEAYGLITSCYDVSPNHYHYAYISKFCFTFKSSRDNVVTVEELKNEIFAQWLINGYVPIVFKPKIGGKTISSPCHYMIADLAQQKAVGKSFNHIINNLFTSILDKCVGKIVWD